MICVVRLQLSIVFCTLDIFMFEEQPHADETGSHGNRGKRQQKTGQGSE